MARSEPPTGVTGRRLDDGTDELLVREEPLAIELAGERVVTMRTPGDDENLALGFLLSEGVLRSMDDVRGTRFRAGDPDQQQPDTLVVDAAAHGPAPRGRLTRIHEIRPSCGLCGLSDLDALLDDLPSLLPGAPRFALASTDTLRTRFAALHRQFDLTGAAHTAAIFAADGALWGAGEDVGRHNALDKAIGRAAREGHSLALGVAFLSGRAGFDLTLKCLRLRIPVILSVSAATAQSFDLCQAAGATLVGFVRPGRPSRVYLSGGRLD